MSCFLFTLPGYSGVAHAACSPGKLGTSRTITIDAKKFRSIRGTERRLGLRHKEVILTFDDGPIAGKTSRILKALRKECVKATFFYVGQMARSYPGLVRKVVSQGHTLAHHTHNHNRLPGYSTKNASRLIDRGIATLQKIAYGDASSIPRTPFFRYPYLARSKRTDRILARKGLIAFDANIDSLDWKTVSPNAVRKRIMRRLRQEGKGIILMHDIQGRTAKMLPDLLRDLKDGGYRIVHMIPKGRTVPEDEPVIVASLDSDDLTTEVQTVIRTDADADEKTDRKLDSQTGSASTAATKATIRRKRLAATIEALRPPANKAGKASKSTVVLANLNLDRPLRSSQQALTTASLEQATRRTGVSVQSTSVRTPSAVAASNESQLKKRKRKRKITAKLRRKKSNKRKSRKRKLAVGAWKLRRSQWILR